LPKTHGREKTASSINVGKTGNPDVENCEN
jgi:hypothetical protein